MVGGGVNGSALLCGDDYPVDVSSRMIFGPFSLQDALDAKVTFSYWLNSQSNQDDLFWGASIDGSNFFGDSVSGDSSGWVNHTFDLKNVPALGDLTGQSKVWFAIKFNSDHSMTYPQGAFIDDFEISQYTAITKVNLPIMYNNYGFVH
jgi:hypothetical protein